MEPSMLRCEQPVQSVENHERVRAYEIAAYLSAASFPFDVTDGPPSDPVPSSDLTLNALVQHGVHRMDCDRAFLSLVDNRNQFICAEMTKHQSLSGPDLAQPLLLGVSKIALEWGVCPYTMSIFHGKTVEIPETPYIVANPSYFYIKDFRQVPSFAARPYVAGYPSMVSYVEIPLRSLSGHILGSYCVVDNRTRDFLEPKALETIREVTQAISSYLDMKRVDASRTRSERMVDGLRQFIGSERHTSPTRCGASAPEGILTGPFDLDVFSRVPQTSLPSHIEQSVESDQSSDCPNTSYSSPSKFPSTTTSFSSSSLPDTMKFTDTNESVTADLEDGFYPPLAQQGSTPRPNMPELADQISDLFSKAAEIIGYAMNLDGLSFFDATTSGTHYKSDHLPSLSVDDEPSQPVANEGDLLAKSLSEYREDDEAAPQLIYRPRQSLIKRLTTEYPQGHVFAIDEFGVLDYESDHAADLNSSPEGHAEKKWEDLFECVPKARYVIFLPLWHYQRESCFATCLAWVSDTGKTLDHGDVNSLTAFGNSLMAEIMRIEALTNTQSKSDFISSISHELRSPLHGILATVDLMQENVTDPDLLSMVDMIESCSSTLLDTFDHLLNFTKINSRANDVGRARESVGHVERVPIDLGSLVEDVLETVTLGHSSAMQMQFGLDSEQHAAMTDSTKEKTSESVIVTTCIENDRNWVMPLEKGAWKRILLNLCSNALKYTKTGYIDVSLRLLEDTEGGLPHISLSVTDTGIGMSPAFLKHHLFTPFMQENHLTPGTGLGLSLVKSIVESINGKIFVVSRLHEGTRVTVNVPLGTEPRPLDRLDSNNNTSTPENSLRGLSLSLLSIASDSSDTKSTPRIVSTPRELSRSIRSICEKKFGMTVLEISTNARPKTDVVLIDTHALASPNMLALERLFTEGSLETTKSAVITLGVPMKGLSDLFGVAEATRISSPITRKRLGTALLTALERIKTDVDTQAEQVSPRSLPIRPASTITETTSPTFLSNDTAIQDPSSTKPDLPKRPTPMYRSPSIDIIPPTPCRFKRFLLVDDNSINLRVLSAFATRIGVPYSLAYNGAEAVHLYQAAALDGKDPFDCVFMDISMPVMDGFRAVAAIRRFEEEQHQSNEAGGGDVRLHQAYILALTGLASGGARVLAKTSGFDGFLVKPVRFRDVLPLLAVQSESATTNPSP